MATQVTFLKTLAAASANNIATSQSPGAGVITLVSAPVVIDTYSTTNNTETGRRVIITSGGNDTGINFTVNGTNSNGQTISDTFAGASGGAAQSNLDFVTVTSVTHTGSVATTITIGTNGVGSSRWITWNYYGNPPMNLGVYVELVSGSINYTVQYTYDDPNNLQNGETTPTALNNPALVAQTGSADSTFSTPIVATRILINSGTGVVRVRFVQAGIG